MASRLLRHLVARRNLRVQLDLQITELQPVRRKHRSERVAIGIDDVHRAVACDDADDWLGRSRRRELPGKATPILLVDRQREGNTRQSRTLRRSGMDGCCRCPRQSIRCHPSKCRAGRRSATAPSPASQPAVQTSSLCKSVHAEATSRVRKASAMIS